MRDLASLDDMELRRILPPIHSTTMRYLKGLASPARTQSLRRRQSAVIVCLALATIPSIAEAADVPMPVWKHLSTKTKTLPEPNGGIQQTSAIVCDIDGDGVNDFIISERLKAPAIIWMKRTAQGWEKYIVEDRQLRPEAGGIAYDVDGDGDMDLIIGGDGRSNELWWYENPAPDFSPGKPWKQHLIKNAGGTAHHDQAVADFKGIGKPQLMFWNQNAKKLFLADFPADPRQSGPWPLVEILDYSEFDPPARPNVQPAITHARIKQEGMAVCDIDGDGKPDLIAGMFWFKHISGDEFKAVRFSDVAGRVAAGWFMPGKYPQIVRSSGDGDGPLMLFTCTGDPLDPKSWVGRDLLGTVVVHGHALQVGDINGDGHLDILCGEMAKWGADNATLINNPYARAWILYGDGAGKFTPTPFSISREFHESKLADLNGDGRLDVLNKPYSWETPGLDIWLNQGNGTALPESAGAHGIGTNAQFRGPVGLQLYSLREINGKCLPLGLQMTRGFGFKEVELAGTYGVPPAKFRERLLAEGFRPVSTIVGYKDITETLDRVIADAKALGAKYVGIGGVRPPGGWTEPFTRELAGTFNRVGAAMAKHGLRYFYHIHGNEFVPHGDGTLFDLLMRETDPQHVTYEMDIFWAHHAGQDPVRLLRKYPGRWELLHLKDMKQGVPTGVLTGSMADKSNDVALGTGQIKLPEILRVAQESGVKHYFIEDESPNSVRQIPVSLRYLSEVRF